MEAAVLQPLIRDITPFTKDSGKPIQLKAKEELPLAPNQKPFPGQQIQKNNFLFLTLNFSLISSEQTQHQQSLSLAETHDDDDDDDDELLL